MGYDTVGAAEWVVHVLYQVATCFTPLPIPFLQPRRLCGDTKCHYYVLGWCQAACHCWRKASQHTDRGNKQPC